MRLAFALLMTALALPAFAKLPPPTDEAKAKAADAALKVAAPHGSSSSRAAGRRTGYRP